MPAGSGLVEPTPTAQSRPADLQAIGQAKTGSIILMVSLILSVIGLYFSFTGAGFISSPITCVGSSCSVSGAAEALIVGQAALSIVGLIIGVVVLLRFRAAFRTLVPFDFRFRSPGSLSILAVIGIVLIALGEIISIAVIAGLFSSCSSLNSTACSTAVINDVGGLLGAVAAIGLGALLLLIGGIMVLIGLWRMGTRYNEGLIKVGAILLIIPFADVVAPFLLYFGFKQAEEKLNATSAMTGGGGGPFTQPLPPASR